MNTWKIWTLCFSKWRKWGQLFILNSSVLINLWTTWNIRGLSGCNAHTQTKKFPCVMGNNCFQKQNLNLFPYKYGRRLFLSVTSLYIHFIFECVNCSAFMHKIQALKNQHYNHILYHRVAFFCWLKLMRVIWFIIYLCIMIFKNFLKQLHFQEGNEG